MQIRAAKKWRPKLSMIIIAVMVLIMMVPLGGIVLFRFFDNQLVQQTEAELIGQTSAIAGLMKQYIKDESKQNPNKFSQASPLRRTNSIINRLEAVSKYPLGSQISESMQKALAEGWLPIFPKLDLSKSPILPPRKTIDEIENSQIIVSNISKKRAELPQYYQQLSNFISPVIKDVQQNTLAGLRLLDIDGTVIAGQKEIGESFAALPEVQTALRGEYASVLRNRAIIRHNPIYSLSRGTKVRVHVAMPVIYQNHVVGVVYGYRTPSNILRELYWQRERVFFIGCFVLAVVSLIGWMFSRTITKPIKALTERTKKLGNGDRLASQPLKRHGSQEVLELSNGLLEMSERIFERTDYINTFATHVSHEIKSPLTAIRGAVELMLEHDNDMSRAEQDKFLQNILSDTQRANKLLDRLRALAYANNIQLGGGCVLSKVLEKLQKKHPTLSVNYVSEINSPKHLGVVLSRENAEIVFSNFIENAIHHGATVLDIKHSSAENETQILIKDNGSGISSGNAEKVFEPFFTTRRDAGGTGMGLSIIKAIINAYKGKIELCRNESGKEGAQFIMTLPHEESKPFKPSS
jgi:signal transduction histidine kinase